VGEVVEIAAAQVGERGAASADLEVRRLQQQLVQLGQRSQVWPGPSS
jgi:hypothetical protein